MKIQKFHGLEWSELYFIAFFIAELGDKTQLTTISLAAQYQNAVSVLIGATLGILLADGIGIVAGVVLGKHIPQRIIKWVSATIFLIFGLVGIYEVLPSKIGSAYTALTLISLIVFSILAIIFITRKRDQAKNLTKMKHANANTPNHS